MQTPYQFSPSHLVFARMLQWKVQGRSNLEQMMGIINYQWNCRTGRKARSQEQQVKVKVSDARGPCWGEDPAARLLDPFLLTQKCMRTPEHNLQWSPVGCPHPPSCFRLISDTKETPRSRISRPRTLGSDVAVFTGEQERKETGRRERGPTAEKFWQDPLEKALELSKQERSICSIFSLSGLFGFIFFSLSAYRDPWPFSLFLQ